MEIIIKGKFKEGKTTLGLFLSKLLILEGAEIQFEDQEEMEASSLLRSIVNSDKLIKKVVENKVIKIKIEQVIRG